MNCERVGLDVMRDLLAVLHVPKHQVEPVLAPPEVLVPRPVPRVARLTRQLVRGELARATLAVGAEAERAPQVVVALRVHGRVGRARAGHARHAAGDGRFLVAQAMQLRRPAVDSEVCRAALVLDSSAVRRPGCGRGRAGIIREVLRDGLLVRALERLRHRSCLRPSWLMERQPAAVLRRIPLFGHLRQMPQLNIVQVGLSGREPPQPREVLLPADVDIHDIPGLDLIHVDLEDGSIDDFIGNRHAHSVVKDRERSSKHRARSR
mmetsp:Transcript_26028/g.82999  ORF Transcript_26028/g.82999 Transcript_26028/m.82999 type:complete len:264 (+) Transcript_26028:2726-3517(+)